MNNVTIRNVDPSDAAELLKIYAYYIENTAITLEYETPSAEEFTGRIVDITKKYPYICAEADNRILGYAYAYQFAARAAYGWDAEVTIYLENTATKQGLGRLLYSRLEEYLKAMGVINLYSRVVTIPIEDEYLTRNSERFHEHMGYRIVGTLKKCAYKFNRWYDLLFMEKNIGEHCENTPPIRPYKC